MEPPTSSPLSGPADFGSIIPKLPPLRREKSDPKIIEKMSVGDSGPPGGPSLREHRGSVIKSSPRPPGPASPDDDFKEHSSRDKGDEKSSGPSLVAQNIGKLQKPWHVDMSMNRENYEILEKMLNELTNPESGYRFISKEDAFNLLKNQPDGTYLIRNSTRRGNYFTMDVSREVEGQGSIIPSHLISADENGFSIVDANTYKLLKTFDDLDKLKTYVNAKTAISEEEVNTHRVKKNANDIMTQSHYFSNLNTVGAKQLLEKAEKGTCLIRYSQSNKNFVVSYIDEKGTFQDHLVNLGDVDYMQSLRNKHPRLQFKPISRNV